ncbi:SgrR family transcriptional regulator [Salmonella enterica subsp. enterica]|nr:SgrR family transcriptional regulator [Salmonella enterica subsp. enterica]
MRCRRGWLTWEAEFGRGKRSRLRLLPRLYRTGAATAAGELLEQDRIDRWYNWSAIKRCKANAHDFPSGTQLPPGAAYSARVLYYRPMHNLCREPHYVARKPILPVKFFSSLARVNEENGELEAGHCAPLAAISLLWRFYLRPALFSSWPRAGDGKMSSPR